MKARDQIEALTKQKDNAYWERNQLVAAVSKIFPSWLAKHPAEDKEWEADWRTIVFVEIPETFLSGDQTKSFPHQLSWHIHDTEIPMFDHLVYRPAAYWDGHDTEEKYRRLRILKPNVSELPLSKI
jgi:hypothetical protein